MTIDELLNQFYSDLILVKRDSEQTALTYKISSEEFLKWLSTEHTKLKDVKPQTLMYYLIKRQTDGCTELTMFKSFQIAFLQSKSKFFCSHWFTDMFKRACMKSFCR